MTWIQPSLGALSLRGRRAHISGIGIAGILALVGILRSVAAVAENHPIPPVPSLGGGALTSQERSCGDAGIDGLTDKQGVKDRCVCSDKTYRDKSGKLVVSKRVLSRAWPSCNLRCSTWSPPPLSLFELEYWWSRGTCPYKGSDDPACKNFCDNCLQETNATTYIGMLMEVNKIVVLALADQIVGSNADRTIGCATSIGQASISIMGSLAGAKSLSEVISILTKNGFFESLNAVTSSLCTVLSCMKKDKKTAIAVGNIGKLLDVACNAGTYTAKQLNCAADALTCKSNAWGREETPACFGLKQSILDRGLPYDNSNCSTCCGAEANHMLGCRHPQDTVTGKKNSQCAQKYQMCINNCQDVSVRCLPQCSDSADNDWDGQIDANDPGCKDPITRLYRADLNDESATQIPVEFALTTNTIGNGKGLVTSKSAAVDILCGVDRNGMRFNQCSSKHDSGYAMALSATPDDHSVFVGWTGSCTGAGTCAIQFDQNKFVTALFEARTGVLSVQKTGRGSGTVTSGPSGINCGKDCSARYIHGTSVGLSAQPAAGSIFMGWNGEGCSGKGACSVTVTGSHQVTAQFDTEKPPCVESGSSAPGLCCGDLTRCDDGTCNVGENSNTSRTCCKGLSRCLDGYCKKSCKTTCSKPQCAAKRCGEGDGCVGICGTCDPGYFCTASGQCLKN